MPEKEVPAIPLEEQQQQEYSAAYSSFRNLWKRKKGFQTIWQDPQAPLHDFETFSVNPSSLFGNGLNQYQVLVGKDSANYVSPEERERRKNESIDLNIRALGNEGNYPLVISVPALSFFAVLHRDKAIYAGEKSEEEETQHRKMLGALARAASSPSLRRPPREALATGTLVPENVFMRKLTERLEAAVDEENPEA